MQKIKSRETVILAKRPEVLIGWYRDILGFELKSSFTDGYHYYVMKTETGISIGIGMFEEMGITPPEPRANTVIMQIEADDVKALLEEVAKSEGTVVYGPSYNKDDGFWFGTINDPEGNQIWVVDSNCP